MYLSQDELSCPVCFEPYDPNPKSECLPKTLPLCGHTLCSKCLCTIIKDKKDQATCPIDQQRLMESWRISISESAIESKFPTNFLVMSLLNKMASQGESSKQCILHKKSLDSLCFTDKELICKECSETCHLGHKTIFIAHIQDLAQQRKKKLEILLDISEKATNEACKVLQEKKDNLLQQKTLDKLDTFEKLLNEKMERAQSQIEKECLQKTESIKAQNVKNAIGIQSQIERLSLPIQNPQFIEAYENPEIAPFCHVNQEDLEDFYRMLNQQIDHELDQVEIHNGTTPEISAILMHLKLSYQNDWLIVSSTEGKSLNGKAQLDNTIINFEEARKFSKINIELSYNKLTMEFVNNLKSFWEKLDNVLTVKFNVLSKDFQDEDLLTLCAYNFWSNQKILSFEINLDNTQIKDDSIIDGLAGSLQKLMNLKKLKVSLKNTKISDQSLGKLSKRSICSMPYLEEIDLDFTGTTITSHGFFQFSYFLKSALESVKEFRLVLSNTKIGDEGLIGYVDYLLPQLKGLERFELCLFNTCITNSSVIRLTDAMKIFKDSLSSLELTLSSNPGITDESLEAFAKNALAGMEKLKTLKLYLRKTGITDPGVNALANSLKEIAPNLTTFDLVLSNTKVTDQGLGFLSEYVFHNFRNLQNFELSLFETRISDSSLDDMCRYMTYNLNNLQKFHLMLSLTNVKDFSLIALGTIMIPQMQNLQSFEFSIRDTKVSDLSLVTLSNNMRNLNSLKNLTLMLNNTKITDQGLKEIVQNVLERPNELETFEINLGFTKITDDSFGSLCDALTQKAKDIKALKLSIGHTGISGRGIKHLCKLLPYMEKVEEFGLEINQIPLDGETATELFVSLESILPNLKTMKFNSTSIPTLDIGISPIVEIRKLIFVHVELYTKKYKKRRERDEYLLMKANTEFSTLPSRASRVQERKTIKPAKIACALPELRKKLFPKINQRSKLPLSNISFATLRDLKENLTSFLQIDRERQRQILGELLFPMVRSLCVVSLAPKVTGMLIDLSVLEVSEVLEFLEDQNLLRERVTEAVELIESESF